MRSLLVLSSLIFGGSAWAADVVYATAEVASVRFPDADTAGPTFAKDARLEVLVEDGDRLRVREGDKYGWIDATLVTTEAPAAADGGQNVDIAKLIEQLKAQGMNVQSSPTPAPK